MSPDDEKFLSAAQGETKLAKANPVETFWLREDPLTGEPFDIPQEGQDAYQAAA